MKYSIEEFIAAAEQELEAWKAKGERKRTDFDYTQLGFIRAVAERLQKVSQNNGKPIVSGSLPPSSEKEFVDNIKYTLSCYETYGTSGMKLFEDIRELINKYCLGGNDR